MCTSTLLLVFHPISSRPNFVAIVADDLGTGDLPCVRGGHKLVSCDEPSFGHPFAEMPNVAQLQAEGTRFIQAYTLGITCSPSRAALMTGRIPPQANIDDSGHLYGNHTGPTTTLTEALADAGYRTAHFGTH
jgi:arylsulfatase A-like enzyme